MKRATAEPERKNESTPSRQRDGCQQSTSNSSADTIASLHRTAGNQAVQRLHENGGLQAKPAQWRSEDRVIQPKLTVNEPDDEYEKEAERVAEQVMRMPDSAAVDTTEEASPDRIQRMCSRCQRRFRMDKPLNCEECEGELQRKERSSKTPVLNDGQDRKLQSLRGGGKPLPKSVRSFFEPRFRYDFSDVRVHTGRTADELAKSVGASAFTIGRDVVFRAGRYRPGTTSGKRLLAHELTHTIQQTGSTPTPSIQRYVRCLSSEAEECGYNPGEVTRSRRTPIQVESVTGSVSGLLVSNFGVGRTDPESDLQDHPNWSSFWGQMVTNPNIRWEILGFTDCTGDSSTNTLIRWERAMAVNNALPQRARDQIDTFRAASLDKCIGDDATEDGRARNRSVLIRQTSTTYEFEPEVIEAEKVCGPDVTSWMVAQMKRNQNHRLVQEMKRQNDSRPLGIPHPDAVATWVSLVGTGQSWDFKQYLGADLNKYTDCRNRCEGKAWSVTLAGHCMTFEAPANIHFGYIGRHAGFSEDTLLGGAALAQIAELRGEWGDDPKDRQAIQKGFELFDAGSPDGLDATELNLNYYENLPGGEGDPDGCEPCPVRLG